MTLKLGHRVVATATFLILGSVPAFAADTPPAKVMGDLWEVTSQMSMEGMPMQMPAQTNKVCAPKQWTEPPAPMDNRHKCENSDFTASGTTYTWKVTCAGPPAMTGTGEITMEGTDAYTGTIKFNSSDGVMKLKLGGKRAGPCELPAKK